MNVQSVVISYDILKKMSLKRVLEKADGHAPSVVFNHGYNGYSLPIDIKEENPKIVWDLAEKMREKMKGNWFLT